MAEQVVVGKLSFRLRKRLGAVRAGRERRAVRIITDQFTGPARLGLSRWPRGESGKRSRLNRSPVRDRTSCRRARTQTSAGSGAAGPRGVGRARGGPAAVEAVRR